ncbi:MAG: response regulator [Nostocaceae cyanobacterium]|nr:response regulator [Nostocaceae cyanobacterium]
MSTTPIGSYRFLQKLHPLSLLAQLTSRNATGCLRVFTEVASWSIYLDSGKLIYASYSEKLFERLESHLQKLNDQIPNLQATWVEAGLKFDDIRDNPSIPYADYQAICYLVEYEYITSNQAAMLIDNLAKETLESFLSLRAGNYEFDQDSAFHELPKFCRLDMRLLVQHCQQQLKNRQNMVSGNRSAAVETLSTTQSFVTPPQPQKNLELSIQSKLEPSPGDNQTVAQKDSSQKLYTIACIDDSIAVLQSIKKFLESSQFSTVLINDPVKALMQILRSKPHLILLDVEMPNLDGYELCSLLRRHSAFKNAPIVMVTGRKGLVDRAKAKMVRASGYLTKPFTKKELLHTISKYLD